MAEQIKFLSDGKTKKKFKVKTTQNEHTITGVLNLCIDAYLADPTGTITTLNALKK